MRTETKLTPLKAVLIGHAVVTAPVITIIAVTALTLYFAVSPRPGATTLLVVDIGAIVGAGLGWLWWSASVPRWREWATQNGAEKEQTQLLAQRTLLVWPKGHLFERTEFRNRNRK